MNEVVVAAIACITGAILACAYLLSGTPGPSPCPPAPPPCPPPPPLPPPPPPLEPQLPAPYTRMDRNGSALVCSPRPCWFRAQDGEDRIYLEMLPRDKPLPRGPDHVIVESGAWQGTDFSTSWVLEYALDWRVVHFEPSAQNFERLVANRPRATNIHRALCSLPDETQVKWLEQNLAGYGGGAVGGMDEHMAPSFRVDYHSEAELAAGRSARTMATCGPMWRYLDTLGLRHIDLFVLDVEGAELEALQGFHWDIAPTVDTWVIEADGRRREKDAAVAQILVAHGYRHKHIGRNDWFSRTLDLR